MTVVHFEPEFEAWRKSARALLEAGVAPESITWAPDDAVATLLPGLLGHEDQSETTTGWGQSEKAHEPVYIPRAFVDAARLAACYREEARWNLLYQIAWRLTHGEAYLLAISVDDDVRRLEMMAKAVSRDRHKMTAFVRFKKVVSDAGDHYIAWHRPDHFIVKLTAPFFVKRFGEMRWSILTPDASAHWNGSELRFGPGVPQADAPVGDSLQDLWLTYYSSIFNPARIKLDAMRKEMPVRHWPTLPETALIPDMLANAPRRVEEMMAKQKAEFPTAETFVPAQPKSLEVLREAACACKGCDLYKHATQTVFGEGPKNAVLMFVGEQPGDQEDLAGQPFIGPAGQLLNQALEKVGIDRTLCYVTNAVKHFKFEPRGKRRIHAKPSAREVTACKPWLQSEVQLLKPPMIVALGATAAQAMMGPQFKIMRDRGQVIQDTQWAPWFMATIHPSALLRIPDEKLKAENYQHFLNDLSIAAKAMSATRGT